MVHRLNGNRGGVVMKFTYDAYSEMLDLLHKNNYRVCDYRNNELDTRKVILRHDVDLSLSKAREFAAFEKECGVRSTYFIMLSSSFYNVFTQNALKDIDAIAQNHDIGLHFDETVYQYLSEEDFKEKVQREADILSAITGVDIQSVSMHRPSPETLKKNYCFPKLINSYSSEFFKQYKYVSDSRMMWRENLEEIIKSGEYSALHILTHPIWYEEKESDLKHVLSDFLAEAKGDRYNDLCNNIRNLQEIIALN